MFSLMGCISNTSEPVEVQIGPAKNVRFNNPNLLSVKKKTVMKTPCRVSRLCPEMETCGSFGSVHRKTFPRACIVNIAHRFKVCIKQSYIIL